MAKTIGIVDGDAKHRAAVIEVLAAVGFDGRGAATVRAGAGVQR